MFRLEAYEWWVENKFYFATNVDKFFTAARFLHGRSGYRKQTNIFIRPHWQIQQQLEEERELALKHAAAGRKEKERILCVLYAAKRTV